MSLTYTIKILAKTQFNTLRTMNTSKNSMHTLVVFISLFLLTNCQQSGNKGFLLGSGTGVNNLTLMVNDIDAAKTYYSDTLGFQTGRINTNGEYEGIQSSAISFSDMTSLEILSLSDSSSQEDAPAFISDYLADHEGIRLFTLSTSSVDSTSLWLVSQGFQMDSVKSFRSSQVSDGWARDDGSMNRKSLDFNQDIPVAQLPRFIEKTNVDYTTTNQQWRTYYGYQRMYRKHQNGVVGISAVKVAVSDLKSSIEKFQNMGFDLIESNDRMARFTLFRNQELQLHSEGSDPVVSDFLSERGEGVFGVRFEVENLDSTTAYLKSNLNEDALKDTQEMISIASEYAKGVQLEFVQEPKEQGEMAAMLSFNQELAPEARKHASNIYTKYCSLCHGDNREGYAADNAPSLKSQSLLATSMNNNFMRYTIQFGRANTAMAGYLDSQGGPLELIDIEILLKWLYEQAGVDEAIDPSREPVYGDISMGATIYEQKCASCHGDKGQGVTAPALGNPMLLATATDHFLRYAIAEGRDGTPMIAFKDSLSEDELDAVTAFLRTRASGWDVPEPSTVTPPSPDEYVLNPEGLNPEFSLREDKFVSAEQVDKAMKEGRKMIIMDARSEVAWRQMHIPGSFPVPYYEEPENFIDDIPDDGTEIVIYCACPHAASLRVMSTLKRYGFENVSIIDEGILVWAQMGYPVMNGK